MQIRRLGNARTYNELKGGDCFLFGSDGGTHVGMKVTHVIGRPTYWVASLFPGQRETKKPVLWSSDAFVSDTLIHLPDAILLPSRRIGEINFARQHDFRSGQLYQSGIQLLMAVSFRKPDNVVFVDLESGEYQENFPSSDAVIYESWKILVPGPDEHEQLCDFLTRSS
jgi:hypothetical protein